MHFNVYGVFYSSNSHQNVSAAFDAIFSVKLLLQHYKGTNVVSCVTVIPLQLEIIIIYLKLCKYYKYRLKMSNI